MPTMTRTQIYIPDDLLFQAKVYAKSQNINLSQLIRDSVKKTIKDTNKKKKTFLDIKPIQMKNPIKYKESWELSKKIDEIVYDL